jgi:hypothetical protein
MSNELVIRNMTRPEVDELVGWAAREGWNPGLHDADLFWATDPEAFIAADLHGELIGGGAITCYNGEFGMQRYYAAGGFVFSHRNMRFCADIPERPATSLIKHQDIIPLAAVPFAKVLDYDRTCLPASRPTFELG